MKTLLSYRPIIRYCHGTESERVYTTRGSMTRFRSRAVDASCLMRITMRHLPLLHLDTRDRLSSARNFSRIHLPIEIPHRFAFYEWNPRFRGIPAQISLFLSRPLFLLELYASWMFLIVVSFYQEQRTFLSITKCTFCENVVQNSEFGEYRKK